MKNLPIKKILGPYGVPGDVLKLKPIFSFFFFNWRCGSLLNSLYENSTTVIPKPDKDNT